jgi:ABC-type transport system involved in multi-copper enzyme maturation permease subunit
MNALRSILSFPLLGRELIERANRRRTYFVRIAYGLVIYGIFVFAVQRLVERSAADTTGLGALGFGRELLQTLVELQCWCLLLVQPALMAGVITYEKERESFPLLLLAGMSPAKMLFEKLLAGLLPMATLLMLALPLGAITMGYGGVSPQLAGAGALVILATWLASGAWALLCSAWCRTTIGALLASYFGGLLLFLLPGVIYSLTVRYVLWGSDLGGVSLPDWVWSAWPPEIFSRILAAQQNVVQAGPAHWSALLSLAAWLCLPLFGVAALFLLIARVILLPRAMTEGRYANEPGRDPSGSLPARRGPLGRLWLWSTGWLRWARPGHQDLPTDDPVAWRESGRSMLGRRGRFLYSVGMLSLATLGLSILLLGMYPLTEAPQRLHNFAALLGGIGVLFLVVRSIEALLSERSNQTLDILLTTPLGADEIVTEKARALGRYWLLFGVLLAIVLGIQGWNQIEYSRVFWRDFSQSVGVAALALAIYPPLIIWTSLGIALLLRRRTRAVITALVVFAIWFKAPGLLLDMFWPSLTDDPQGLWLSLLSPLGILEASERSVLSEFSRNYYRTGRWHTAIGQPWAPVAINFLFYGMLLVFIRWCCRRMAERCLRK